MKRLESYDFMKGVLIMCVIWGHLCMYLSGSDYEKNELTTYIRLFQMPLFILISGFFQKSVVTLDDLKSKLRKSILHIGIPLIIWSILTYLIKLLVNFNDYNDYNFFIFQSKGILSLYWFLVCLLLCLLFYAILDYIYHKSHYLGIILYLISPLITWLFIDIFHFSFLWLFFLIGVLFKRMEIINQKFRLIISKFDRMKQIAVGGCRIIIFSIGILFVFISGHLLKTDYTFYNVDNSLLTKDSGYSSELIFILCRYLIYIPATLVAYKLIMLTYRKLSMYLLCKYIASIGKETLFLYTMHIMVMAVLIYPLLVKFTGNNGILTDYPFVRYYIVCTILTILLVLTCFKLSLIIKKNKYLSKLLLGL